MAYLCGVVTVLIAESIVLMVAKAWSKKIAKEVKTNDS